MMLRVRSLMRSSAAYSVVVLPEPVGPVTSMMPCGLWISSSMQRRGLRIHAERVRGRAGRPACRAGAAPRARRARTGSSRRARRPRGRRRAGRCGRPAAGASRRCRVCAMTLMRETISGATARWVCSTSRSTPSTRKRTTSRFSNGSMWMSEAFSLTAWVSSALIRRMIGARPRFPAGRTVRAAPGRGAEVGVFLEAAHCVHRGARRRPRRPGAAASRTARRPRARSCSGRRRWRRTSARRAATRRRASTTSARVRRRGHAPARRGAWRTRTAAAAAGRRRAGRGQDRFVGCGSAHGLSGGGRRRVAALAAKGVVGVAAGPGPGRRRRLVLEDGRRRGLDLRAFGRRQPGGAVPARRTYRTARASRASGSVGWRSRRHQRYLAARAACRCWSRR